MKLTEPIRNVDAIPETDAEPSIGAAVIVDARTFAGRIVVIQVIDFYEGWAA